MESGQVRPPPLPARLLRCPVDNVATQASAAPAGYSRAKPSPPTQRMPASLPTPTPLAATARRVAGRSLALLLVPALAMTLTDAVRWGPGDFVAAGLLLFGAGMLHTLALSRVRGRAARVTVTLAVLLGLLTVWAELAVGLFD
jgi:hypothetical protein